MQLVLKKYAKITHYTGYKMLKLNIKYRVK